GDQPAADSRLGRGTPAVLPYRARQRQPAGRAGDGRGPVHRARPARRPDGAGVLQRHPATAPLTPPQPEVTMTRLPPRRLLVLALATAASATALPALAQAGSPFAAPAQAAAPATPFAAPAPAP